LGRYGIGVSWLIGQTKTASNLIEFLVKLRTTAKAAEAKLHFWGFASAGSTIPIS
jgi:hypothetical protein